MQGLDLHLRLEDLLLRLHEVPRGVRLCGSGLPRRQRLEVRHGPVIQLLLEVGYPLFYRLLPLGVDLLRDPGVVRVRQDIALDLKVGKLFLDELDVRVVRLLHHPHEFLFLLGKALLVRRQGLLERFEVDVDGITACFQLRELCRDPRGLRVKRDDAGGLHVRFQDVLTRIQRAPLGDQLVLQELTAGFHARLA